MALLLSNLVSEAVAVISTRILEGATDSVPDGEVLTIIDCEFKVVVRVVRAAVDVRAEALGHAVVTVMDGDGPKIHKEK